MPGITPIARIGNTRFADFLKKSRRDNKSFLSCSFIFYDRFDQIYKKWCLILQCYLVFDYMMKILP